MKIAWSNYKRLPILDAQSQPVFAGVQATLFHPETGQVLAFVVGFGRVLTPVDIQKWGKDALHISSREDASLPTEIQRLQEFPMRQCLVQRKKVLSKSGKTLGRVSDFAIDTATARLLSIEVVRPFTLFKKSPRIFSAQDISEITERHIQLRLEDVEPEGIKKPHLAAGFLN